MQIRIKPVVIFLLITTVTGIVACSGIQKETGYHHIHLPIDKDTAAAAKARIVQISNDSFKAGVYSGNRADSIRYRLLSPVTLYPNKKYPLVLVLPTSAGIGTDNKNQLNVLVKMWAQPAIREKYPAFVVAPQFPRRASNYIADADKKVLVSKPDSCLLTALDLIDSLKKVLPVDKQKVYVLGFSMGASATINAIGLRPGLFKAAVAISGIPDFAGLKTITDMPVWIIHGNADTENPFATDSLLYREMSVSQSSYLRFWEVKGLEHTIYPPLYMTDMLPLWLFKQ